MDATQRMMIEWQCQQIALRFVGHSDRQEWRAMCRLLTEDATFARPTDPDNPIAGRAEILAAFEARPTDRITRHLISNLVVEAQSGTEATGRMYALLYMGSGEDPIRTGGAALAADGKQLIGEFEDRYRLTEDGWRIAERSGRLVFSSD